MIPHVLLFVGVWGAGTVAILALAPRLRSPVIPPALVAGLGGAALAAAAYLLFWLWLWHPTVGRVSALATWGVAAVSLWRQRQHLRATVQKLDTTLPLLLWLGIGLLHLGSLHLYGDGSDPAKLAATRFLGPLPIDNEIPFLFAERLATGVSPRQLVGDWLSSDRPPLQTGVVLFMTPLFDGVAPRSILAQASGVWFQLLWVPAAWGLLRLLPLKLAAVAAIVSVTALSGQLLLHGVYVWPKLAAAALVVMVFTLGWAARPATPARFALAGACAGLAWLAHGGAAFSLLALAVVGWWWRRPTWPMIGAGAAVFLVFVLPWSAYQKFYEPPGNRLLKWHLAGVIPPDERGFVETLKQSYDALPPEQAWRNKQSNVTYLAYDGFAGRLNIATAYAEGRRVPELFYFVRGLGFWPLAFLLLPWWWWRHRPGAATASTLLGWTVLTVILWVLLMFGPNYTTIHQGSLAVPLVTLLAAAAVAWGVHPTWFAAFALWQVLQFFVTWLPPTAAARHAFNPLALAPLLAGFLLLAGLAWRAAVWPDRADDAEPAGTPPTR